MSHEDLSSHNIFRLDAMLQQAEEHYMNQGCSPSVAYEAATRAVYLKTGYMAQSAGGGASRRGSRDVPSRGGRANPQAGMYEGAYGAPPSNHAASSARYAEYPGGGHSGSEVLSSEEIRKRCIQILNDLVEEGVDANYACQQAEKFAVREFEKRNRAAWEKAGYHGRDESRFEYDGYGAGRDQSSGSEYDDYSVSRGQSRRSEHDSYSTSRDQSSGSEYDDYSASRGQSHRSEHDSYSTSRDQSPRSEYARHNPSPQERYTTSHEYSDAELRAIAEKIYSEWLERGIHPEEARHEALKWYHRHKGRGTASSTGRSGFDGFDDARGHFDGEDSYSRHSEYSRGARGGKDAHSDQYSTNKPPGIKPEMDLYELLGVGKSATVEEIKQVRRKLCIKHHPDRVQGGVAAKKAATEMMAQINQACDVLMDGEMRAIYDRTGLIASVGESPDA